MKKIFSLLAAVLFAGAMMADSYTIEFKDNGTSSDGTSSMTSTTVADYIATGAEYVSAIEATGKVYNAQTGYGLKFGNSSNPGAVTLTLATPVKPTSIVMNASQWGSTEGSGLLQDSTIDMTAGGGKGSFNDYTYAYDGNTEITTIVVGTKTKRGFVKSVTVYYEGGVTPPVTLTEPAAAPDAPTVPANQVKAVYSATYNADCGFGEWGSGTAYTQETVGKKYVTTNLGYFGLEFAEHLNCAKMEKLHLDVWVAADASIRIVPIWGGAEQGIVKNLVGQQWNAVEIALTDFDQVTNWTDVYQIKIDNAANLTFWLNNVYFYTTVAPAADTEAPQNVTASLVSASYFSAKISATATDNSDAVIFVVKDGENELATAPAVSGVAKEITVAGLLPNTAYNFSVIAKDEAGNAAAPVAVAATTFAAPAPATAPTYAADKVLGVYTDVYTNKLSEIQNWWEGPAISEGNLTATSKALCIEPSATIPAGACFGLAFAASDITAYDALEMDVYATVEGAIKIQVIGDNANLPAATVCNLVAGQWNHVVLDIKGNTKTNCEQIGFYDCQLMAGAIFVQNVLFVDTDAPVVEAMSLTQFLADKPATEVELKDLTVIYATGKNTYVIDEDGVALVMFDANKTYYDGTLTAGKVLSGQKATYTSYKNQDEIIPTNAVVATDGTAAVPVLMTAKPSVTANVNQYLRFENVAAAANNNKYYIFEDVQLYGASNDLKPTEDGNYNVEGIFINYNSNTPELIVTAIEKVATPPSGDEINVTIASGLQYTDAVATSGWWQILGENDDYFITLSNGNDITEAAGTYTVDDLDADYSWMVDLATEDTISFTAGSVVLAVDAQGVVTVVGKLTGNDGNVYAINLTYAEPKAETTVVINIPDAELDDSYATYGLYGVAGTSANNEYVQLYIWADEFAGDFTEEDLDTYYFGSGVIDAAGTQSIYSAVINVVANADGSYVITADLLCYNNTLYKVTMTVPAGEGVENVNAAVKAIKRLVNGTVVIEKNGKAFNVNGAQL